MKLSVNFTMEELTHSATAIRRKIDNEPTGEAVVRLQELVTEVLQPLRDAWGAPIVVNSGFRSSALNDLVGGASESQHMQGEAADIRTLNDSPADNKALFALAVCLVRDGKIKVGQLIDEFDYSWIHISLPNARHRNQVLHLKKRSK